MSESFKQHLVSEIYQQTFNFPISLYSSGAYQFALLAAYQRSFGLEPNQQAMPLSVLDPIPGYKGQNLSVPGNILPGTKMVSVSVDIDHSIKAPKIDYSFHHMIMPGYYAVPGEKIKVEVISGQWDGKGTVVTLRINQHTDNLTGKTTINRSPQVSGKLNLVPGEYELARHMVACWRFMWASRDRIYKHELHLRVG